LGSLEVADWEGERGRGGYFVSFERSLREFEFLYWSIDSGIELERFNGRGSRTPKYKLALYYNARTK